MQPLSTLGMTGALATLGLTACGADPKPEATSPGSAPASAIAPAPVTEVSRIGALPASDANAAGAVPSDAPKSTPAWAGAVGAAGGPSVGGAPPTPNVGAAPTPEHVEVAVGASFEVHMDSNPTTGFAWRIREPLDPHLVAGPKRYEGAPKAAPGEPQMVGRGGVEYFSFTGVSAGEATLVLEYVRSWEKRPADTFRTWQVVVK